MVQQKKFEQTFINEYMAIKLHEYDVEQRGIAKGRAKGIVQGKTKGKTDVAVGMLKIGVPIETVAQGTGLSVEYLKTLV